MHLERQRCRQSFVELMLKTQWLDCEPVSVMINDIMSPLITNQNIFLTIITLITIPVSVNKNPNLHLLINHDLDQNAIQESFLDAEASLAPTPILVGF